MLQSQARLNTTVPRRYMSQLCKHFQHKLPVTLNDDDGSITFSSGVCTLQAEPEALVLRAEAADPEALAQLEGVVGRHLERFAFREAITLDWQQAPPT